MATRMRGGRSVRRRQNQEPFNPLQNPYQNQGQFNKAVKQRARESYQPALGDVRSQRRTEDQTHLGRNQDITRYFGNFERSLSDAARGTTEALNKLIASREGTSRAAQGSLGAALRATDQAATERAAALGVSPSTSQSQGLEQAAYGIGEAGANNLSGNVASMIAAANARRSLAPLGAMQASRTENARNTNVLEGLRARRSEIVGRIPDARERAREELYQQALAQQNQGFQQELAGKQFGLSRQQLGLQERQFGLQREQFQHQKEIDWANVGINREQVQVQREQIQAEIQKAGTAEQKEAAQAKAKRWDNASNWLATYLTPGDSEVLKIDHEGRKTTKLKKGFKRDFSQAYRILTIRFGLGQKEAARLLTTVTLPGWRGRARIRLGDNPKFPEDPGYKKSNKLNPSVRKRK